MTTTDRIPAIGFSIERAEGSISECFKSEHSTWADAEERILRICRTSPKEGGYCKTDFKILFADGAIYAGRYDAAFPGSRAFEGTLADHVGGGLVFDSGLKRPDHFTEELYQRLTRDTAQGARAFLKAYAIPNYSI